MLFISLATFISTAASNAWHDIAEWFKNLWEWFINSGLAEKTADTIARIISFDGWELDELMWKWLNTIFGR